MSQHQTKSKASISGLVRQLWPHFTTRRRTQFLLLLLLMLASSFAEMLSIGAIVPFLAVLTAPEKILTLPALQPLLQAAGLTDQDQFLFVFTLFFAIAALGSGAMRLLLLWVNARLSFAAGSDLSIASKTGTVIYAIVAVLNLVGNTVMLVVILLSLLLINPMVSLLSFAGFGSIYAVIILGSRKQLKENSKQIAAQSTQVIKALQEGLGGIRDVLIDGSQEMYCTIYRQADKPLRHAQGSNLFLGSSPRYALEAIGMVLIAALAYMLSRQPEGMGTAIPVLGSLAFGAQRLLPVMQQLYTAWSTVQGTHASVTDIVELLEQPIPDYALKPVPSPLSFTKEIKLQCAGFLTSLSADIMPGHGALKAPEQKRSRES